MFVCVFVWGRVLYTQVYVYMYQLVYCYHVFFCLLHLSLSQFALILFIPLLQCFIVDLSRDNLHCIDPASTFACPFSTVLRNICLLYNDRTHSSLTIRPLQGPYNNRFTPSARARLQLCSSKRSNSTRMTLHIQNDRSEIGNQTTPKTVPVKTKYT